MARLNAREMQEQSKDELLAYLQANGPVSYRQVYENVSAAAIQQYRALKRSGQIKSTVAHNGDGTISHTVQINQEQA